MGRDHRKLRVFRLADALVVKVYQETAAFPREEQYGLQAQVRRAMVSVAANLVGGSARRSSSEYANFVNIAMGSAAEAAYLLNLAGRLGFIRGEAQETLVRESQELAASLQSLGRALALLDNSPKPQVPDFPE